MRIEVWGKIYLVSEAYYGNKHIRGEEIYRLGESSEKPLYKEFFDMKDCSKLERAKDRDKFISTLFMVAVDYFKASGFFDHVCYVACDANTKVILWGLDIYPDRKGSISTRIIDCKNNKVAI